MLVCVLSFAAALGRHGCSEHHGCGLHPLIPEEPVGCTSLLDDIPVGDIEKWNRWCDSACAAAPDTESCKPVCKCPAVAKSKVSASKQQEEEATQEDEGEEAVTERQLENTQEEPAGDPAVAVPKTCKCTITKEKLGKIGRRSLEGESRESTRYLFLLGYPFTGTSAVHALLSASDKVSTLDNTSKVTPSKEGWDKMGWKQRTDRWNGTDEAFDWNFLSEFYHKHWNLKKPLLLECSPPEILRAEALNRTFSKSGKVRFVLLTNSLCSHDAELNGWENRKSNDTKLGWNEWRDRLGHHFPVKRGHEKTMTGAEQIMEIKRKFGPDALIARYEDLCLNYQETLDDLERWEPLLGGLSRHLKLDTLSPSPSPSLSNDSAHTHLSVPFPEYCKKYKNPVWERGMLMPTPPTDAWPSEATKALQYTAVDACVT